jgi:hypothetical protein
MNMNATSILEVAPVQNSWTVVTDDGRAVWPLRNSEDKKALALLATVFGAKLQEVRATEGKTSGTRDCDDYVLGLGAESFAAAELYSHLTNRNLKRIEHPDDSLLNADLKGVVVTTAGMLTYQLLEQLFGTPNRSQLPGIVFASDEQELFRHVLLRAAASVLCGPVIEERIDIAPILPASALPRARGRVVGGDSSVEEIRAALGAGAGLLNILTHSDGVDAYLGATTLCPIESLDAADQGSDLPRCVVRGVCHRHPISLTEASRASFLVRPSELAGRLLFFHTCKGVLPVGSLVDPSWSVLARLLHNPRIGAVATTWEMTMLVTADLQRVARSLQKGISVGAGLADFLGLRDVRRRNLRICLFGDPRLRVAPTKINERSHRHSTPVRGETFGPK